MAEAIARKRRRKGGSDNMLNTGLLVENLWNYLYQKEQINYATYKKGLKTIKSSKKGVR